jgi:hypothetical protein
MAADQKPRDPVAENMAILMSKPVKAFLQQDHQSHIMVHQSFMSDPKIGMLLGQNPNAQVMFNAMQAHIAEHAAYAYRAQVQQAMGVELPDPNEKWDIIHFNHGLHDLSYRFADDSDKNAKGEYASPANGGHQNVPPGDYEKNLRQIIARLKQTGAKLIFASTTPVPESDAAKYVKDSELPYNEIAKKVMTEEGVTWNDLCSLVKPRQAELQGKRNVHFQLKGSSVMAKQVAEMIQNALSARKAQP